MESTSAGPSLSRLMYLKGKGAAIFLKCHVGFGTINAHPGGKPCTHRASLRAKLDAVGWGDPALRPKCGHTCYRIWAPDSQSRDLDHMQSSAGCTKPGQGAIERLTPYDAGDFFGRRNRYPLLTRISVHRCLCVPTRPVADLSMTMGSKKDDRERVSRPDSRIAYTNQMGSPI